MAVRPPNGRPKIVPDVFLTRPLINSASKIGPYQLGLRDRPTRRPPACSDCPHQTPDWQRRLPRGLLSQRGTISGAGT